MTGVDFDFIDSFFPERSDASSVKKEECDPWLEPFTCEYEPDDPPDDGGSGGGGSSGGGGGGSPPVLINSFDCTPSNATLGSTITCSVYPVETATVESYTFEFADSSHSPIVNATGAWTWTFGAWGSGTVVVLVSLDGSQYTSSYFVDILNDCEPAYDPSCEKPLTPDDVSAIQNALGYFNWGVTGADAVQACSDMRNIFELMLADGRVFRGNTDGPDEGADHGALYDGITGHMHFDPALLNAAQLGYSDYLKNLLNSALHEGAHALSINNTHGDPVEDGPWGPQYNEEPFNWLAPGSNSCINY